MSWLADAVRRGAGLPPGDGVGEDGVMRVRCVDGVLEVSVPGVDLAALSAPDWQPPVSAPRLEPPGALCETAPAAMAVPAAVVAAESAAELAVGDVPEPVAALSALVVEPLPSPRALAVEPEGMWVPWRFG